MGTRTDPRGGAASSSGAASDAGEGPAPGVGRAAFVSPETRSLDLAGAVAARAGRGPPRGPDRLPDLGSARIATARNAVVVCHALTGSADADLLVDAACSGRAAPSTRSRTSSSARTSSGAATARPGRPRSTPPPARPWLGDLPGHHRPRHGPGAARARGRARGEAGPHGDRRLARRDAGRSSGRSLYPELVESVVFIASTARHSAWCIGLSEAQRQAIYADPRWRGGRYDPADPPAAGLAAARHDGDALVPEPAVASRCGSGGGRRPRTPSPSRATCATRGRSSSSGSTPPPTSRSPGRWTPTTSPAAAATSRRCCAVDPPADAGGVDRLRRPLLAVGAARGREPRAERAARGDGLAARPRRVPHRRGPALRHGRRLPRPRAAVPRARRRPQRRRARPRRQGYAERGVSLLVLGKGKVGGELLEQIRTQRTELERDYDMVLRVVGVADTPRRRPRRGGARPRPLARAPRGRAGGGAARRRQRARAPRPARHACLGRCSSTSPPRTGWRTSTSRRSAAASTWSASNKRPLAIPPRRIEQLRQVRRQHHRHYHYDTAVGASLPVHRHAPAPGPLRRPGAASWRARSRGPSASSAPSSSAGVPLSLATRWAVGLGYAEADPRDDLSGLDRPARRSSSPASSGAQVAIEDVTVEPFVRAGAARAREPRRRSSRRSARTTTSSPRGSRRSASGGGAALPRPHRARRGRPLARSGRAAAVARRHRARAARRGGGVRRLHHRASLRAPAPGAGRGRRRREHRRRRAGETCSGCRRLGAR